MQDKCHKFFFLDTQKKIIIRQSSRLQYCVIRVQQVKFYSLLQKVCINQSNIHDDTKHFWRKPTLCEKFPVKTKMCKPLPLYSHHIFSHTLFAPFRFYHTFRYLLPQTRKLHFKKSWYYFLTFFPCSFSYVSYNSLSSVDATTSIFFSATRTNSSKKSHPAHTA